MERSKRLRLKTASFLLVWVLTAQAQGEDMQTITDNHHLLAYMVAALMIGIFVMLFCNRLYYYREKEVKRHADQLNSQLELVLDSNKTQVWTQDVQTRMITIISSSDGNHAEYTPLDFSQFFDPNDVKSLRNSLAIVRNGTKASETLRIKGNRPAEGHGEQKELEVYLSVLRYNEDGKPSVLIGIQKDITESLKNNEESRKMALRFHTVFNSSQVDMIYYDENGILTDFNDKACETFNIEDRDALLKRKVHINDIPSYRDIDIKTFDRMAISSITDIDQTKRTDERVPEIKIGGKFYYEATVSVIRDEENKLYGVIAAGRNITEMVESHHRQNESRKQLMEANRNIQAYIDNINYSLKVSEVRLVNYHPDSHELEIANDLNKTQYRLTQQRCLSLVADSDKRHAEGLFRRMDNRHDGLFMESVQIRLRDKEGRAIVLTFRIVPVTDKEGHITHYFGMCRNDTEIVSTERELRVETEKAQETEQLKNMFLMNMSYEIRTPLNAVLGFAELFNEEHDAADEPVFAEEIKKNTNNLLELINDILFISRLDAHMVEFDYKECDFAMLFDGFCYMGWNALKPGVKVSVDNPYAHLMVNIDEHHLGKVISLLCANAARYTQEGTIKAKYEYRHGELCISIEDTGKGISQKMLPHIFERFVRDEQNEHCGTGLNLPIIKEVTEQMGGTIEAQSEKDKGTTVYIIIPCAMSGLEKKQFNDELLAI